MSDVETLKPLADSLDNYARQIHSIAEIIRHSIELAEDNSDAERVPHSARGGPHDGQRGHLDSTLPVLKRRPGRHSPSARRPRRRARSPTRRAR